MSLSFKRIKRKIRNKLWRFFFYKEVSAFEKKYTIGYLETLEKINAEQLSLARFGDGELNLLCMEPIKFQSCSTALSNDLKNVLHTKVDRLLVCLPTFLDSPIPQENIFWTNFWCEHWKKSSLSLTPIHAMVKLKFHVPSALKYTKATQ